MTRKPCSGCGRPRETGGVWGYCLECDRAYDYWRRRKPGRVCYECKVPLTTPRTRCKECERRYRDRVYQRRGRVCPECTGPIKNGYRSMRCQDCDSLWAAEQRQKRKG